MESNKSLDDSINIIAALLQDVSDAHVTVFNTRACRLTTQVVRRRVLQEGLSFLTKTLPRLGKAFDKAIAGARPLNASEIDFSSIKGGKLPRFLGEFFSRVLQQDGSLLPDPCANSVEVIRQVTYLFYKYELPYTAHQEQEVIQTFERTEDDIKTHWSTDANITDISACTRCDYSCTSLDLFEIPMKRRVTHRAKGLLNNLFAFFDPRDIYPRHGPGAVATKQRLWDKYRWKNISSRVTDYFPLDEYFYSSLGHVCDEFDRMDSIDEADLPARVILVPKDSRGPRLISCEPVEFQWVQQGLGKAIVKLVEQHPLTKWNVHFTDQVPNRIGALWGSQSGRYATLDLKEASDRVALDLVRLLFPKDLVKALEAARTCATELPDGKVLPLNKFAPMGSSLCFPIMALTIWAILTAAAPDTYTRERILVYGDDVIVPTAYAESAIEQLETFGLLVNRDKSCTSGLFRESCGMDAFKGIDVTPVRLRTVWSSNRRADVYTSWIAYANRFYDKRYYRVYNLIVDRLNSIYGAIPSDGMNLSCPSLRTVPAHLEPKRTRTNSDLQKLEYRVWDVKAPVIKKAIRGWSMLLRYFSEANNQVAGSPAGQGALSDRPLEAGHPFAVRQYTSRRTSMLVRRWR